MTRIIRHPPAYLLFGAFFFFVPLGMYISSSRGFAREGIEFNGVHYYGAGAFLAHTAFFSLFWLVGVGLMAHVWFGRTVTDTHGLAIYNTFNRKVFSAYWSEVTGLERSTERRWSRGIPCWRVSSGAASHGFFPVVTGELMCLLVGNVAREFWEPCSRPQGEVSRIGGNLRGPKDRDVCFFALAWTCFCLAAIVFVVATGWRGSIVNGETLGFAQFGLFMVVGILLFLAVGWVAFLLPVARYLKGRVQADEEKLIYTDGIHNVGFYWDEVWFAETQPVDDGEDGVSEKLVLVTADQSIEIPSGVRSYAELKKLVAAVVPEDALVYLDAP